MMRNRTSLDIDVNVKLRVDTDTAYQALNIIDIWLDENPRRQIEVKQIEDGTWINNLITAPEDDGLQESQQ